MYYLKGAAAFGDTEEHVECCETLTSRRAFF